MEFATLSSLFLDIFSPPIITIKPVQCLFAFNTPSHVGTHWVIALLATHSSNCGCNQRRSHGVNTEGGARTAVAYTINTRSSSNINGSLLNLVMIIICLLLFQTAFQAYLNTGGMCIIIIIITAFAATLFFLY